jgi:hypothetical protein
VGVVVRLFIFNFNKLLKIVFLFLILSIVYNIYIIIYSPKITIFQNQWQQNYSFAQDFIYENNKTNNIIVGSSMAARMKNDFLPNNYSNLSFGGGSSLTGLEIIKKTGYIPKYIYIENNIIFRGKDITMIDNLFYPILWKLKKIVPALKEKYQPLNIILSNLKGSYGKSHKEHMLVKRDNDIFNMMIGRQKLNYDKNLTNYSNKLNDLKSLIKHFEDKGTIVVFFEMPIDSDLASSIQSLEQRKIIKNSFNNKWLPLPINNKYITGDGIHLLYSSAYKYSNVFVKEAQILEEHHKYNSNE